MSMNPRLMRPSRSTAPIPRFGLVTADGDLLVTANAEPLVFNPVRVIESYGRWAFHGNDGTKFTNSNQYLEDVYVHVSIFGPAGTGFIDDNSTYFLWDDRGAKGMLHWMDAGYGLGPVGYSDTLNDLLHELGYSQVTFIPTPPSPGVGRVILTGALAAGMHPNGYGFRVAIRENGALGGWDSVLFFLEAVSQGGNLAFSDALLNTSGLSPIQAIGILESFLYLGYDGISSQSVMPFDWMDA